MKTMMMHRGVIDVSAMYVDSFLGGLTNPKELRILASAWSWFDEKFVSPVVGGLIGRAKGQVPKVMDKTRSGAYAICARIASEASRATEKAKRLAEQIAKRI